jgi:hypothetical protein
MANERERFLTAKAIAVATSPKSPVKNDTLNPTSNAIGETPAVAQHSALPWRDRRHPVKSLWSLGHEITRRERKCEKSRSCVTSAAEFTASTLATCTAPLTIA